MKLSGLDHADIRVPSLAAVEPFYDALLPALGLSRKSTSHVGPDGEWYDVDATYPALFFEDPVSTRLEICARRPRA